MLECHAKLSPCMSSHRQGSRYHVPFFVALLKWLGKQVRTADFALQEFHLCGTYDTTYRGACMHVWLLTSGY